MSIQTAEVCAIRSNPLLLRPCALVAHITLISPCPRSKKRSFTATSQAGAALLFALFITDMLGAMRGSQASRLRRPAAALGARWRAVSAAAPPTVRRRDGTEATLGKSNPRGFIEYERNPEPYRPPAERSLDYQEINSKVRLEEDPLELKRQAARCMDCGTPFCQTHTGCPINNLIPEFNNLVLTEQWHKAYVNLSSTNNFPEFTGRVCPAPCEGSCVAGLVDKAVTIKNMECEARSAPAPRKNALPKVSPPLLARPMARTRDSRPTAPPPPLCSQTILSTRPGRMAGSSRSLRRSAPATPSP